MRYRIVSSTLAALAALSIAVNTGSPARATGAQVTRGALHPFAAAISDPALAGEYSDLNGHVQMVRTADGKTIVTVHVSGLLGNVAYPSHVHKAACADGAADGHYRFDPSGPADSYNEIWMSFTSGPDGTGQDSAKADRTAGPEAISIVVHAPGGAKIGCADLT
jgi:superoxide dismutase, Cu-Zn family